jgi:hypothetical protein
VARCNVPVASSPPDARVKRLRAMGWHDGRVQRRVAQALAARGGRIDTGTAFEAAYPGASRQDKGRYRNVRVALSRIAIKAGCSEVLLGRPLVWWAR